MKYVKILGLLAVVAAALMAFAGPASATTLTSPTGTAFTGEIHAENENGHVKLENPIAKIECVSTVKGPIDSHGTEVTAIGHITSLSFTGCTNGWHVTAFEVAEVNHPTGTLEVHWTSNYDGVLTSNGTRVDSTRLGVTCVYETNNTKLGTVTGGNPATLDIEATIPINTKLSSGLCGTAAAKWEGNYKTTDPLYIDHQ